MTGDSYGYENGRAVKTLASALRNQLTPMRCLIDFLETGEANEEWEKRFRDGAIESVDRMKELLQNFKYKE